MAGSSVIRTATWRRLKTESLALDHRGISSLRAQREAILELALEKPELSPRELAVTYTDEQACFVSESTVYRLLKAHDLITSPAYILMEARDKFQHPTTWVNEMWQTDFTYCKVIGWGWRLPWCRNRESI